MKFTPAPMAASRKERFSAVLASRLVPRPIRFSLWRPSAMVLDVAATGTFFRRASRWHARGAGPGWNRWLAENRRSVGGLPPFPVGAASGETGRVIGKCLRIGLPLLLALAILVAVGAALVHWQFGTQEKSARAAATRFAAALVADDPGAAPLGGGDYVSGARAYFGPVSDAKVVGSDRKSARSNSGGRNFPVVQLLLGTERGAAVIELEFDDGAFLKSKEISAAYELEPPGAPGLAAHERDQLAAAYAARGGEPADRYALRAAGAPPQPTAPLPVRQSPAPPSDGKPGLDKAQKQLRCIQSARGDVAKLQHCTLS